MRSKRVAVPRCCQRYPTRAARIRIPTTVRMRGNSRKRLKAAPVLVAKLIAKNPGITVTWGWTVRITDLIA